LLQTALLQLDLLGKKFGEDSEKEKKTRRHKIYQTRPKLVEARTIEAVRT